MNTELLEAGFRKMRGYLKHLPKRPPSDEVRHLRAQTRRVEVAIRVCCPHHGKQFKRLLTVLEELRQAAGRVRDADVSLSLALTLEDRGELWPRQQLIEDLSVARRRRARELSRVIKRRGAQADSLMQRCAAEITEQISASQPETTNGSPSSSSVSNLEVFASGLVRELSDGPPLREKDLHGFRLKVKELRYVLEFAGGEKLASIGQLVEVKDAIGDWHDCRGLALRAAALLGEQRCVLVEEIQVMQRRRLAKALRKARTLRRLLRGWVVEGADFRRASTEGSTPTPGRLAKVVSSASGKQRALKPGRWLSRAASQ